MADGAGRRGVSGTPGVSYEVPGRNGQRSFYYPRALVVLQPKIRQTGGDVEIARAGIVPVSVTVVRDQAERCDTADIALRVRDFPLDPRAVADCRVSVYMADVELPDVELYPDNTAYAQFIGFVDEYEWTFDDGGPRVRLRCRDYAGRLLEQKYDGAPIRTDATLLDIIVKLVDAAPGFERLRITIENDKPLKSFVRADLWTPPRAGSLWDVIAALARDAGQEASFDLGVLVLRTPRNITEPRARALTLGQTVTRVSLMKTPAPLYRAAIGLRQVNARSGEVVEAWWPKDVPSPSRIMYPVAGSYTRADLERMAKSAFEAVATMSVQGSLETAHMADDFGEDLCGVESVRSGDTLFVQIAGDGTTGPLGQPAPQLVAYLQAGGVSADEAAQIVGSWGRMEELNNLFMIRRAVHTIDANGYRLSVDFENVVRAS